MNESGLQPEELERVPYSRIRAATSRRLTESVTTKPHVTLHARAAIDGLFTAMSQLRGARSDQVRLIHLLIRVVTQALVDVPTLNGWVRDATMSRAVPVNLGIAVQTERGLLTPVLRDANRVRFSELVARVDDLITRAREGRLHPLDLADGTFTLSSLGANRVEHFTPIINPPQLAILGIGRAHVSPCWDENTNAWLPVQLLPLSLTFDHAAIDGQPAAAFLDHVANIMEAPPQALWAD